MGKKLGDMTPGERRACIERVTAQLAAELEAAAPAISRIMEPDFDPYDPNYPSQEWRNELAAD